MVGVFGFLGRLIFGAARGASRAGALSSRVMGRSAHTAFGRAVSTPSLHGSASSIARSTSLTSLPSNTAGNAIRLRNMQRLNLTPRLSLRNSSSGSQWSVNSMQNNVRRLNQVQRVNPHSSNPHAAQRINPPPPHQHPQVIVRQGQMIRYPSDGIRPAQSLTSLRGNASIRSTSTAQGFANPHYRTPHNLRSLHVASDSDLLSTRIPRFQHRYMQPRITRGNLFQKAGRSLKRAGQAVKGSARRLKQWAGRNKSALAITGATVAIPSVIGGIVSGVQEANAMAREGAFLKSMQPGASVPEVMQSGYGSFPSSGYGGAYNGGGGGPTYNVTYGAPKQYQVGKVRKRKNKRSKKQSAAKRQKMSKRTYRRRRSGGKRRARRRTGPKRLKQLSRRHKRKVGGQRRSHKRVKFPAF
jgi:hypothetical protein